MGINALQTGDVPSRTDLPPISGGSFSLNRETNKITQFLAQLRKELIPFYLIFSKATESISSMAYHVENKMPCAHPYSKTKWRGERFQVCHRLSCSFADLHASLRDDNASLVRRWNADVNQQQSPTVNSSYENLQSKQFPKTSETRRPTGRHS